MTSIVLNHPRDDAKMVIKASMEKLEAIDNYIDDGQRIIGQQNASLTGGNGAKLTVDIPEAQEQENKTEISVEAEKEVSIDIATKPESIKSDFLSIMNKVREKSIDEIITEKNKLTQSKEISNSTDFEDAESTYAKRFLIIFASFMGISIIFGLIMFIIILIVWAGIWASIFP